MSLLVRWGGQILPLLIISIVFIVAVNGGIPRLSEEFMGFLQNFKIIFLSIVIEALPFVLIGSIVSSFIQVFISEQTLRRWVPSKPFYAALFGVSLGIIFPVCECGIVAIARRLIRKGMPVYVAVTFMISAPILNPIVFLSTFMAFRSSTEIAYSRMGLTIVISLAVAFVIYMVYRSTQNDGVAVLREAPKAHHEHHHAHGKSTKAQRFSEIMRHATDEFFFMGKFLILGAMLAALVQTLVPRAILLAIGTTDWSAHGFMMVFAFVMSLCSEADAFVAASFISTFSAGSLLTFMIFGPMLDLKNTFMLLAMFKWRFVLLLAGTLVIFVPVATIIVERLFLQ